MIPLSFRFVSERHLRGYNGRDFHARVDAGFQNGIAFRLPGSPGAAGDQAAAGAIASDRAYPRARRRAVAALQGVRADGCRRLSIDGRGERQSLLNFPYDEREGTKADRWCRRLLFEARGRHRDEATAHRAPARCGIRQEPGWHIRRLADLAEIERELKALGEEL
jgi:hypothetical protein